MNQLNPGDPADVVVSAWEVPDHLDVDLLTVVARGIGQDHDALRTVLRTVDGSVRQVVLDALPNVEISLPEGLSVDEVLDQVHETGFDLESGPLWRIDLVRSVDGRHVLVVTMHTAIGDVRSVDLVVRDVLDRHEMLARGEVPVPRPTCFSDFTVGQHQASAQHLEEWRRRVMANPPVIDLPSDLARPRLPRPRTRRIPLGIDGHLLERLDALAKSYQTTADIVVLTICALTVRAFSQRDEFVLGVWQDNRPAGAEAAVGPFAELRPVALEVSDVPSLREYVIRVRDQVSDAAAVPFGLIVDELGLPRDLGRHPLVQVAFAYRVRDVPSSCSPVFETIGASRLDLEFTVDVGPNGPWAHLSYAVDTFDDLTMASVVRTFHDLATTLAHASASGLSYVYEPHSVTGLNPEPVKVSTGVTVAQMVESRAVVAPDAVAVVQGPVRWTYRRLVERADALAGILTGSGVGPGDLVAVHGRRQPNLIAAYVAAFKVGAAYVPIGQDTPPARLAAILADASPKVVLTDHADVPEGPWESVPLSAEGGARATEGRLGPRDLAYVCYTSGSTGKPKGVGIEHRSLTHFVNWHLDAYELGPSDVVSWATGIGFDASIGDVWPSLTAGATIVLPDDEMLRLQPEAFARWLDDSGVTMCFLPSPLAEAFLDNTAPDQVPRLRFLLTGGDRFARRPSPKAAYRVVNQYGPTENTVWSTYCVVSAEGAGPSTIGKPIPNVRAYVLDGQRRLLPRGAFGELYLGGPQVAKGYLNLPELSDDRFLADPFVTDPDARMYRTGDVVRWRASGELQFLGRSDGQVKIRGVRIEPAEIEAVLVEHPAVREAAVVARPGRTGHPELVAHLVPCGTSVDTAELAVFVRQRLPQAFWPSAYQVTESFPLTVNGKLDRAALASVPFPENTPSHSARAPQGPVEELLSRVWMEVLNRDRISVEDNFFALGGDSLLAIQVVSRLTAKGVRVRLIDLFDQPTVAELAARVKGPRVVGPTPVAHCLQTALRECLPVSGRVHVVQAPDDIDLAEVETAARQVVLRHDQFRVRLSPDTESPAAQGDGGVHIEVCDDVKATLEDQIARARALTDRLDGTALSIVHMRSARQLVVAGHPLCIDPESWPVVLAELTGTTPPFVTCRSEWLAEANKSYRTTTSELLLASAVLAIHDTSDWSDVAVDLETDGRHDGLPLVGQCTMRQRVVLRICGDVAKVITGVRNTLRSSAQGEPAEAAHDLRLAYHDPQWTELGPGWKRVGEVPAISPNGYDLDIEVTPGEPEPHIVAAEGFADAYRTALRAVRDHCASVHQGQLTASDFPLFGLVKPCTSKGDEQRA